MYQAIYKCRLCGRKYKTYSTLDKIVAEECVHRITREENYYPAESKIEVHRFDYHNCKDGSFGLADFQGFKKAEE